MCFVHFVVCLMWSLSRQIVDVTMEFSQKNKQWIRTSSLTSVFWLPKNEQFMPHVTASAI